MEFVFHGTVIYEVKEKQRYKIRKYKLLFQYGTSATSGN